MAQKRRKKELETFVLQQHNCVYIHFSMCRYVINFCSSYSRVDEVEDADARGAVVAGPGNKKRPLFRSDIF